MTEKCNPNATGFFHTCGQFSQCQPITNTCVHDPPYTPKAGIIISYIITPILIGIGILGGLGGGVLKGPLLEMILNYTQSEATHIAYCLMFGGTLLNTILLMFEKNPEDQRRPIINYRISIIFNLAVPFATNLGSSLASFLPQLYTLILQELFLFAVAPILWKKAQKAKSEELSTPDKQKNESQALNLDGSNTQQKIELQKIEEQQYSVSLTSFSVENSKQNSNTLYYQFKQETENILPFMPALFILGSFGLNQIFIQMRSTNPSKPSYVGIYDCTWQNDFMILILIIANVLFDYVAWNFGSRQEKYFDQLNYLPNERYFTPISRFFKIYAGGFGAGFVSGFLGMGAGFVMVPTLLYSGLIPRCASATSAFIYFMISLNNLITLLTNHYLDQQMILLFTGLAVIGGSVITKIGYILLSKYKIGYTVILIVFALDIANILSQIYYGVVFGIRYGLDYLTKANIICKQQ
ncbi:unnamed protein product (macronuclear) [Paramecium tetraurelia]|uniref:Sulfite exporter TauE/SafE n=1 Tax=Paramecium tetraurelia TaxID=5888 RepID=A0C5D1_PARTE|nr:uncharacterized protein GSPATT00006497001 [Paramecium tetraurelia]CAK65998.1 unnamed protein product [Paramecium tetraurelia]|eukprot:XP_001433395.1 hypothetical protein (macronuclear) [Paramecium tetraurelia strain d4-2]